VVAQLGMWWLSWGCGGSVGDVVAQLGGCGDSVGELVAQLGGYGGFVWDVVAQFGDVVAQLGVCDFSVRDVVAQLGMWWLSWLWRLGELDCNAEVLGSIQASPQSPEGRQELLLCNKNQISGCEASLPEYKTIFKKFR
jgi:hypothetical protein